MPDQSTASKEHALLQEITAPLANLPDDPVPAVADVEFPVALRGYDRMAVDAYVRRTSQLVAELQATHSPEAAVRRALERVGEEVSDILKRAHDTASQITAQSRSDAEDRVEAAREEAAEITAGAERRLRELDTETDRIWAERHRIVEDARALAEQLLTLAQSAAERFPPEEAADPESAAEDATAAQDGASTEDDATRASSAADSDPSAQEPEAFLEDEPEDEDESARDDVEATAVMPTLKAEDEQTS